jgi:hypothetical protein
MLRAIIVALIGVGSGLIVGLAAAPTAAACPAGTYQATSGDCVESPDGSPANATAICKDGTDSHSESRSGTCSRHGGVAQWCPCGSTAAASSPPVFSADPSTQAVSGDDFVALAISPNTGSVGWGAAGGRTACFLKTVMVPVSAGLGGSRCGGRRSEEPWSLPAALLRR